MKSLIPYGPHQSSFSTCFSTSCHLNHLPRYWYALFPPDSLSLPHSEIHRYPSLPSTPRFPPSSVPQPVQIAHNHAVIPNQQLNSSYISISLVVAMAVGVAQKYRSFHARHRVHFSFPPVGLTSDWLSSPPPPIVVRNNSLRGRRNALHLPLPLPRRHSMARVHALYQPPKSDLSPESFSRRKGHSVCLRTLS